MPDFKAILDEVSEVPQPVDVVRRRYVHELSVLTGRNTIVYYSAWLQKPELAARNVPGFEVNDADKNGFMAAIYGLERRLGLDLILHTPGGEIAATESLVEYLRQMFGNNIRAIVPQMAMSAGTMIALACKELMMGHHSSIGPIDPQIYGLPAHGVIEEFERARREVLDDAQVAPLWQPVLAKYHPTLIGEAEKAIEWTQAIVTEWLRTSMVADAADPDNASEAIVRQLSDLAQNKAHARHVSIERARQMGLPVTALEDDQQLQEAVLTVHHACVHTIGSTPAIKLIENQNGVAFVNNVVGRAN